MTPFLADLDVTLYHGDVLDVLRELPDESVDCAATSPPFFGLRDYQTGRWEGGDEGCDHGAAYAEKRDADREKNLTGTPRDPVRTICRCGARRIDQQIGLESTPEEWRDRLVEVFREVRRVLVPTGTLWVECGDSYANNGAGGGSPVQVRDPARDHRGRSGTVPSDEPKGQRITTGRVPPGLKAKDLIGSPFLLAFGLRDDGWWWRSTNIWAKPNCLPESVTDRPVVSHSYVFQFSKKARYFYDAEAVREPAEWARWGDQTVVKEHTRERNVGGRTDGFTTGSGGDGFSPHPSGRSLRSVWTIPTQGYPEAHFATWPEALARRIILAGCPVDGTILDPFVGSGTTCFVARKLGRRSVGIDLNASYLDLAARRLQQQSLLAVEA